MLLTTNVYLLTRTALGGRRSTKHPARAKNCAFLQASGLLEIGSTFGSNSCQIDRFLGTFVLPTVVELRPNRRLCSVVPSFSFAAGVPRLNRRTGRPPAAKIAGRLRTDMGRNRRVHQDTIAALYVLQAVRSSAISHRRRRLSTTLLRIPLVGAGCDVYALRASRPRIAGLEAFSTAWRALRNRSVVRGTSRGVRARGVDFSLNLPISPRTR